MGRHAKKKCRGTQVFRVAGITTGSLALPLAMPAHQANAATLDEWETVAECESGGDWSINYSGDGMSVGGLQFQNASWQAALSYLNGQGYDTSTWPQELYQGMSDVPSKEQTILAAEALLHLQGPGAWVCSGVYSASMFDGGVDPLGGVVPDSGTTTGSTGGLAETYTVEPGDTLYGISLRFLGDGHKWGRVYHEGDNEETIGDDPHLIYPGQVLDMNDKTEGTEPSTSEAVPAPSSQAQVAVDWAISAIGTPYLWGGNSIGSGLDCSGLTSQAWLAAGVSIPRTSQDQLAGLPMVSDPQPGDLVVYTFSGYADHVAMYVGPIGPNGEDLIDTASSHVNGGVDWNTMSTRGGTVAGIVRPGG
jgi:resuscitation-promoting factor RpfA